MKEQKNKQWSLILFRKEAKMEIDNINSAEFIFGRTKKEVLANTMIERVPKGLISMIKSNNLEEDIMETGFVIEFTTKNPNSDKYSEIERLVSISGTFEKYGQALYAVDGEDSPLRFIDVSKPCEAPAVMPSRIWLSIRPLSLHEISWGLENNIFTNGSKNVHEGEQFTLNDCGFKIERSEREIATKIKKTNELPFPGPSEVKYNFLN